MSVELSQLVIQVSQPLAQQSDDSSAYIFCTNVGGIFISKNKKMRFYFKNKQKITLFKIKKKEEGTPGTDK